MPDEIPGILIIDTPGHDSFQNMRAKGMSVCDIAILLVDVHKGLEIQSSLCLEMLMKENIPFVVAINKIDTVDRSGYYFEKQLKFIKLQFSEKGVNTTETIQSDEYIKLIPISALTGEGVSDLMRFVSTALPLTSFVKHDVLKCALECLIMDVNITDGYGHTLDVVLTQGQLNKGDTIIVPGSDKPIVTIIKHILQTDSPQNIKIVAKDLETAIAGFPLYVSHSDEQLEEAKNKVVLLSKKTDKFGISIHAMSTSSSEAVTDLLQKEKIHISRSNIGLVRKCDVMKIALQKNEKDRVILAFNVPVDSDANICAIENNVTIISADVLYKLLDELKKFYSNMDTKNKEKFKHLAVFPCILNIIPTCIFNKCDPIILGVTVVEGILVKGTPLSTRTGQELGIVESIEINHIHVERASSGQEVCIKIIPKSEKFLFGRHFTSSDQLFSKISRESVDVCKTYFRADITNENWLLMKKLKETIFKFT